MSDAVPRVAVPVRVYCTPGMSGRNLLLTVMEAAEKFFTLKSFSVTGWTGDGVAAASARGRGMAASAASPAAAMKR